MFVNEKKIDAMGTISSSEATMPNLQKVSQKSISVSGYYSRSVRASIFLHKVILAGSAHLLELEILYHISANDLQTP